MKAFRSLLLSLILVTVLTACNGKDQQASLFTDENQNEVENELQDTIPSEKEEKRGFFQNFLRGDDVEEIETTDTPTVETTNDISEEGVSFQIISPKAERRVETSNTRVVIFGNIQSAEKVAKVQVNDYVLRKYRAGDKQFSYIASESLKTLKRGENNYEIKAFDASGKLLAQTSYTIVSDAKYEALTDSGFESWIFALMLAGVASIVLVRKKEVFNR